MRNLERLQLLIQKQSAAAEQDYQTALATVAKYEDAILPKAQESLRLIEQARDAGEAEFLRVLSARQVYFELNQQAIVARGELAQAAARIEGLLLTGGLENGTEFSGDVGLRGQALGSQ